MSETRNPTRNTNRADEPRQTMADVNHVHRHDPGASTRFYSRGPPAFTDGGETEEPTATGSEDDEEETEHRSDERPKMKDVSHTPPDGDREVNRVFERGEEGHDGR